MGQQYLPQNNSLYVEDGFWKMGTREPTYIGPATGQDGLTENEAQRIASRKLLPLFYPAMTIAEFVERKFVPEHVALKESSGKEHYRAMLKHVLFPEAVERVFRANPNPPRMKLKANPDWPYLNNVRLCDARPDHIHRLTTAAIERGYSSQTVTHIRHVVSAIFSHARREQYYWGNNPVTTVKPPEITHKESYALTIEQVKEILAITKYPEKQMILLAIYTDMTVSEICGLQWKHINLTEETFNIEGEHIPPMTIAVRKQWHRGKLMDVKKSSIRNLLIPKQLLQILSRYHDHWSFIRPDDYVLASRVGTPINQTNIAARQLKSIARKVGVPSLTWQMFRRTRKALKSEYGLQLQNPR